ncbi:agenet domain-containing protein [Tanacetum coccineum]
MIREYKAIKEKEDPGVFVLPIQLEGRFDTHALADTGSNINIIPYRIFEELGREHVKPVSHNVSMLNNSESEPMGMLKGVLCQIGVTMVLLQPLMVFATKKFYVAEIQNKGAESDNDDEEEYYLKRDEMGRPFYGPNLISYFDRNDPMERALAIQDSINPFQKICVWKKAVAFLGSLPVPLLHTD